MAGKERYVLGLSGGRDSAALAVYMRQNHPEYGSGLLLHRHRQGVARGVRVPGQAGRVPRQADNASESRPGLRLLAEAVQQFPSFAADPMVHPSVEAASLSSSGFARASTKGIPFTATSPSGQMKSTGKATPPSTTNLIVRLPLKDAGIDKSGSAGYTRQRWFGVAGILRMAHPQRLYLLLLPTEDRVGSTDGAPSSLF